MLGNALPFIEDYVKEVSKALSQLAPNGNLSATQEKWLKFCLMGILMTNSIKWSNFYRASLGKYKISALSWMLRYSKIFWERLLQASTIAILKKYRLKKGVLILDDTDKKRSKRTTRIHRAHKVFDKSTGGYFNGQTLVFLILATDKITIPVGFQFYYPEDLSLKLKVTPKSKLDLGIDLLKKFSINFPNFKVKAILADALYGAKGFADEVEKIYPKSQYVSQLRSNQIVFSQGKKLSLQKYFSRRKGVFKRVRLRGQDRDIEYLGARLKVDSHGKKRFIIALKYEGEMDYRFIYGTRLAWRGEDIIKVYALRWLIEVFFQDCKSFEGLGELQLLDKEGSERAVTLSLLFDCSLFFHEEQVKLIEDKLSAFTVGGLLRKCRVEAFLFYLKDFLLSDDPMAALNKMEEGIKSIYGLRTSKKHMVGVDLGKMEAQTNALKYRAREETPVAA